MEHEPTEKLELGVGIGMLLMALICLWALFILAKHTQEMKRIEIQHKNCEIEHDQNRESKATPKET